MLWRFLLLYLVSALTGTGCDWLHVRSDVLSYPQPFYPGGQAVWVPFLFGAAGPVLVLQSVLLRKWWPAPAASPTDLLTTLTGFVLAYLSTTWLQAQPLALLALLVITWGLHSWLRRDRGLWGYALLVACGGCLFEGTLAATGAFVYRQPQFYHVPIWLFGLYLHAALLTRTLAALYFTKPSAEQAL